MFLVTNKPCELELATLNLNVITPNGRFVLRYAT